MSASESDRAKLNRFKDCICIVFCGMDEYMEKCKKSCINHELNLNNWDVLTIGELIERKIK